MPVKLVVVLVPTCLRAPTPAVNPIAATMAMMTLPLRLQGFGEAVAAKGASSSICAISAEARTTLVALSCYYSCERRPACAIPLTITIH